MKNQTRLYLIPTAISPDDVSHQQVREILPEIEVFICERVRTTRRWLRSAISNYNIDGRTFLEFEKHSGNFPLSDIKKAWNAGKICGLTSEAGTPAVADPGFQVVAAAHQQNIPVIPLPGNNSIILALMASGLNGNQFTYHGYFPINEKQLQNTVNRILPSIRHGYSQIFIETPYRNLKTLTSLLKVLPDNLTLSISSAILSSDGRTHTRTVKEWKSVDVGYLNKVPAVFVIGQR